MSRPGRRPHTRQQWQHAIGRLVLAVDADNQDEIAQVLADVGRHATRDLAIGTAQFAATVFAQFGAVTGDDWRALLDSQINEIELNTEGERA